MIEQMEERVQAKYESFVRQMDTLHGIDGFDYNIGDTLMAASDYCKACSFPNTRIDVLEDIICQLMAEHRWHMEQATKGGNNND